MDAHCITRTLGFHGQPLLKIWEDERGAGDLSKCSVEKDVNFTVYQERQKSFTFQDRAKRLKLHQFLARKANALYDSSWTKPTQISNVDEKCKAAKLYAAVMPPYESFVGKHHDRVKHMRCVLEGIRPGDIVYGIVTKANSMYSTSPMIIKPLCTAEPLVRYLNDVPIKAYVQVNSLRSPSCDGRGKPRAFGVNNYVCCEVIEISVDADRMGLSLEKVLSKNTTINLGLVSAEDLPVYYRKTKDCENKKYEDYLCMSKEMLNPNFDILYEMNRLDINQTYSMFNYFKDPFPSQSYVKELRQAQAASWALRSVGEGIEHFKEGNPFKAFQCLNHALKVDPLNVEGLVARGALYANKGSFLKAVEDFEKALKMDLYHTNARRYMGETLVALGRSYEDDNRLKDAEKAYSDCLEIIPNHGQAELSLKAVRQRLGIIAFDNPAEINQSMHNKSPQKEFVKSTHSAESIETEERSLKQYSSTSSDDNGSSDSESERSGFKQLSPLSERMAMHSAAMETAEGYNRKIDKYMSHVNKISSSNRNEERSDDETRTRVKKLLADASKHQKEKNRKHKTRRDRTAENESKLMGTYKNTERNIFDELERCENSIADVKRRQRILSSRRSESPVPEPPSMNVHDNSKPSSSSAYGYSSGQPKFSFQIKKPVKIDKFGLVRIATPLAQKSSNTSRSTSRSPSHDARSENRRRKNTRTRSKSRAHSRYRTLSPGSRSHSRSHYRSISRSSSVERKRRRYRSSQPSRSGSRSPSVDRSYRSRPPFIRKRRSTYREERRRTPSPFIPRDTPPPRRQRSRSRYRSKSRETFKQSSTYQPRFGNRVWQRPGYAASSADDANASSERNWSQDRYDKNMGGTSNRRGRRKS